METISPRPFPVDMPRDFSLATAQAQGKLNQCVIRTYQHVLGGKWKLLILSYLLDETRRYGELRRLIPEISEKMLIQELRELEADRLLIRKQYPEVPPRVEYLLTDIGQALTPIFHTLVRWSAQYIQSALDSNEAPCPTPAP
jgi:DNA-binding HxlR family transcriptional regulator